MQCLLNDQTAKQPIKVECNCFRDMAENKITWLYFHVTSLWSAIFSVIKEISNFNISENEGELVFI